MEPPVFEPCARLAAARGDRPAELRAAGLWRCGSLTGLGRPCVAVVGTRAATPLGKRLARQLAADLGRSGCCIVSGLALGIDTAAHEGALDARAATIGVLGGGHGHFFPRRNRELAERMAASGGAVLSPFAPDWPARPAQFLARNAVVAGLADAVVVVEAPARSGALNTASWAAGRIPVLAFPGDVDRRHAAGCLALIRDGATLVRDAADVLEALGILALPLYAQAEPARERDPATRSLLNALDAGARGLDELLAATGLPAPEALAALTGLELEGIVAAEPGSRFSRTR